MTKAPLFVALLLCSFAIAAVRADVYDVDSDLIVRSVEDELRDSLRRVDEYIQKQCSRIEREEQVLDMLSQMTTAASKVLEKCEGKRTSFANENAGSPLIEDTDEEKMIMYELKGMIQKDCVVKTNVSFHYFHAVENEDGAVLYTFVPVSSPLIAR
ncbi:hypothetical protein Tcan_11540 [Toxocara canis]|uniref:Secreted protein n=1 Tax=Toxocara canis TaxID=6265 RepID=A0A0B2UVF2_TOXCA|nr:hypothetical protein Tcan_11540 [Toxocara canis]